MSEHTSHIMLAILVTSVFWLFFVSYLCRLIQAQLIEALRQIDEWQTMYRRERDLNYKWVQAYEQLKARFRKVCPPESNEDKTPDRNNPDWWKEN